MKIFCYLCGITKRQNDMIQYEAWCEEMNLQARENRLERDIVVLEGVHAVPLLDTEYHTHYYYIGLCLSGYTLGTYNYRPTQFRAGDICWIMPDHVISHNYVSDDYSVLSVYISKRFYEKFKLHGALGKFHYPMRAVILSLTPEQFGVMAEGFRMMARLSTLDHPQRDEMLTMMCSLLATLGDEFILQQHPEFAGGQKPQEELFEHFYQLIARHYRESREVAFYAKKLALTPKYFATVIKQTTGMAATEWINRYVLVEAKWLLRQDRQKSIQQIAYLLGFTEQASFSRFFKAHSGQTPTEYRENM